MLSTAAEKLRYQLKNLLSQYIVVPKLKFPKRQTSDLCYK